MALTATALVLLSAVLHVAWNLLVKSSADPRAFMAVKGIPFLALGAGALIWIPLDALPPALWACVILSGLGIGHSSCILTQRPSMGVMLNP